MALISKIHFYIKHNISFFKRKDPFHIDKKIFKKYLPPNPIIVDCGSHIGTDSIELTRIFPDAVVHSFEPVPEIFFRLKQNTADYNNIICYQLALGNQDTKASMYISSYASDGSSSLLKPDQHLTDHPDVLFNEKIMVDINTLDTWAAKNSIIKVDLLWLDMQGLEYQTLKASKKVLPNVKVVHTEVSVKSTYEGVVQYQDLKLWMESQNFEVLIEAIPQGSDMGNVVFIKTNNF